MEKTTPYLSPQSLLHWIGSLLCLVLLVALGLVSCTDGRLEAIYSDEELQLLDQLDQSISQKANYFSQKEAYIDSLRSSFRSAKSDSVRVLRLKLLSDAFLSYQFDSAFHYIRLSRKILSNLPLASEETRTRYLLDEVLVLTSAGLFNESTSLLNRLDTTALSPETKQYALWVTTKTYYDLASYTRSLHGIDTLYTHTAIESSRRLLSYLPSNEWIHPFVSGHERMVSGAEADAIADFEKVTNTPEVPQHARSISEAILGDLYAQMGKPSHSLSHYAHSALIDIQTATRENTSLLKLSKLLFEKGDLDRAYLYAQSALEDANFYNAYHRKVAIGDVMPMVESQRYTRLDNRRQSLSSGLLLVAFLCLILLVLSFVIFRQMKKLKKAHQTIATHNETLSHINHKLSEANAIKEEYIGISFYNDAAHIQKLEKLYRFVNNKLRDKKYSEIKSAFDAKELEKERENMYEIFDTTFLRLFPNFIDRYNALFVPEEQAKPQAGRLTTEMRIFALIRLGISKSEDIARFLDYSIHTINTYKTRVKNKSHLDNAQFEEAILAIDATVTAFPEKRPKGNSYE